MILSHRVARDMRLIVNERAVRTLGDADFCDLYPSACRAHDATREHITTDERDEQHRIIGYSTHSVHDSSVLWICAMQYMHAHSGVDYCSRYNTREINYNIALL